MAVALGRPSVAHDAGAFRAAGRPDPRRYGRWVSRDDFVAYLTDYAERFQIEPELGVRVTRVDRDGDGGWQVETATAGAGAVRRTDSVVIATG